MSVFSHDHVCLACGHIGQPKSITSGSFIGEAALWIIAILIASSSSWAVLIAPLIYSIYRISTKKQGCGLCSSTQIIPAESPNGQALIASKNSSASE